MAVGLMPLCGWHVAAMGGNGDYVASKKPPMVLDFVVIGLPGSGTCFWSQVLSEGAKSYCSHEYFPGESRVEANVQGDSSSRWLVEPCTVKRRLLVVRDLDGCLKSVLRRYPNYSEELGDVIVKELAIEMDKITREDGKESMKIEWHPRFTCNEIRDVFKFCVGEDICKARANLFSEINITKEE